MRSPMIEAAEWLSPEDKKLVSDLQVIYSHGAYYIGTLMTKDGITEPCSRDSGYFKEKAGAETLLEKIIKGEPDALKCLRRTP